MMSTEFDQYASRYTRLLDDPIRNRFARDASFFVQRKWSLISAFLEHQKMRTADLTWLDVGCGKGELLSLGAGRFGRSLGCDPSARMIESCSSTEVRQQTRSTDLPFADASVDFITAVCVYHHVQQEDRAALTKAIKRVLRPNGVFCMIEHNPYNPATRTIVKRCPVDADAQLLTASSAQKLFLAAGLSMLDTTFFLYFPESLFRRLAWVETALRHVPLGGQFAVFGRK